MKRLTLLVSVAVVFACLGALPAMAQRDADLEKMFNELGPSAKKTSELNVKEKVTGAARVSLIERQLNEAEELVKKSGEGLDGREQKKLQAVINILKVIAEQAREGDKASMAALDTYFKIRHQKDLQALSGPWEEHRMQREESRKGGDVLPGIINGEHVVYDMRGEKRTFSKAAFEAYENGASHFAVVDGILRLPDEAKVKEEKNVMFIDFRPKHK